MDFIKNNKMILIIGITAFLAIFLVCFWNENKGDHSKTEEWESIADENKSYIEEVGNIKVHIAGYVANEGIIETKEGARINDIIKLARRTYRRS